jgi:hypothetical protein
MLNIPKKKAKGGKMSYAQLFSIKGDRFSDVVLVLNILDPKLKKKNF